VVRSYNIIMAAGYIPLNVRIGEKKCTVDD
jgi:hypothetical protein